MARHASRHGAGVTGDGWYPMTTDNKGCRTRGLAAQSRHVLTPRALSPGSFQLSNDSLYVLITLLLRTEVTILYSRACHVQITLVYLYLFVPFFTHVCVVFVELFGLVR